MKKLIAKIREILRNRRVRKLWTRTVSSIACLVVFVTTYALVLPAITMESQALCGIEAHQHDDSCYEERLTCTIPEADGHTHTEDCYSTKQKSICDRSEHEHNSDCYDENGNLTCSLEEHQHGRECFEDTWELVCGLEEAEGHHHDSSCYEKVLTCGKEAHTHSQACYREDAASEMATERAAVAATTAGSEGGNTAADADGADGSSDAFGTLDPAQTPSEGNVPAPDELNLQQPLNSDAAISNDSPAVDETRGSGNSDAGITSDDSSSAEENITEAVEETHPAVSFEDTLTVYTGSLGSDITGSLSSDTNAGNPGNDAAVSPDTDTAAGTLPASSNMTVSVSAEAGTFPAGTTMVLSAVTDMDAVAEAVEGTVDSKTRGFQAVDISFRDKDGNEIEPLKPICVTMRSDSIKAATEDSSMAPVVVHVEDRNKETAEAGDSPAATVVETLPDTAESKENPETPAATNSPDSISFEADAFSVYAIVYTVDFEYSVNGKMYQFSLPGGGFVSFTDLVEVLGIIIDTYNEENRDKNTALIDTAEVQDVNGLLYVTASDSAKKFVTDVASVEFSSPELVDVSKVEADTTIGQIKKSRGLECQYSAEITEEQIAEINAQTVKAGDWALISVLPFASEETLTVTMKDGEVFTIRVTDAQIKKTVISASGATYVITVTYGDDADVPVGANLDVTEITMEKDNSAEISSVYGISYEEYVNYTENALGMEKGSAEYIRLFDIRIVDSDGNKVEIQAPVEVKIELADAKSDELAVVHFADEKEAGYTVEGMIVTPEEEGGQTVEFHTNSFSVYAVVGTESYLVEEDVRLVNQEINAVIYDDWKFTKLSNYQDITITLSGELPVGAYVNAYPAEVSASDDAREVIAAYDIKIYYENENGELREYQPDDDRSVKVSFGIPFIVEYENVTVYHIDTPVRPDEEEKESAIFSDTKIDVAVEYGDKPGKIVSCDAEEIKGAVVDDMALSVEFDANSFSIYDIEGDDLSLQGKILLRNTSKSSSSTDGSVTGSVMLSETLEKGITIPLGYFSETMADKYSAEENGAYDYICARLGDYVLSGVFYDEDKDVYYVTSDDNEITGTVIDQDSDIIVYYAHDIRDVTYRVFVNGTEVDSSAFDRYLSIVGSSRSYATEDYNFSIYPAMGYDVGNVSYVLDNDASKSLAPNSKDPDDTTNSVFYTISGNDIPKPDGTGHLTVSVNLAAQSNTITFTGSNTQFSFDRSTALPYAPSEFFANGYNYKSGRTNKCNNYVVLSQPVRLYTTKDSGCCACAHGLS